MADDTISLESLQNLANELTGDISDKINNFIESLEKGSETSVKFADVTAALGREIADMATKAVSATANIDIFGKTSEVASKQAGGAFEFLNKLIESAGKTASVSGDEISEMGIKTALVLEPAFKILPKGIDGFGELGRSAVSSGTQIENSYKSVQPILDQTLFKIPLIGKAFSQVTESAIKGADSVFAMERNIISLAAASGDLNSLIIDQGDAFVDLNAEYASFTENAFAVAQSTGFTITEIMNFSKALGTIPGALRENVEVGDDNVKMMNQLSASLKLAAGFGLSGSDVIGKLNDVYRRFNLTGTEAFKTLASIYQTAQDTQLPMDIVTNSVMNAASGFKLLGDNTMAATNVMLQFGKAFKDSNLSPEGIQQVVGAMTSGIARMNEGQKAFISSQTGGPGGLAGAFQIDYALQQGNMDEVLGRTMEAMQQQFGGQVLTLQQAAESPAMAGEFYKQVAFLKDVAGIASTNQEAYRILEAMQSGVVGDLQLGGSETGDEALASAVKRGTAIQEDSNTILTSINNELEMTRMIQASNQKELIQQTIGIKGMAGPKVQQAMSEGLKMATATGGIGMVTESATAGTVKKSSNIQELTNKQMEMLSDTMKDLTSTLKEAFTSNEVVKNIATTTVSTVSQTFGGNVVGGATVVNKGPSAGNTFNIIDPEGNVTTKTAGGGGGGTSGINLQIPPMTGTLDVKLDFSDIEPGLKKMVKAELKSAEQGSVNQNLTGTKN